MKNLKGARHGGAPVTLALRGGRAPRMPASTSSYSVWLWEVPGV